MNTDPSALYGSHFGVKNEGIGPENTSYWNVYDEYLCFKYNLALSADSQNLHLIAAFGLNLHLDIRIIISTMYI